MDKPQPISAAKRELHLLLCNPRARAFGKHIDASSVPRIRELGEMIQDGYAHAVFRAVELLLGHQEDYTLDPDTFLAVLKALLALETFKQNDTPDRFLMDTLEASRSMAVPVEFSVRLVQLLLDELFSVFQDLDLTDGHGKYISVLDYVKSVQGLPRDVRALFDTSELQVVTEMLRLENDTTRGWSDYLDALIQKGHLPCLTPYAANRYPELEDRLNWYKSVRREFLHHRTQDMLARQAARSVQIGADAWRLIFYNRRVDELSRGKSGGPVFFLVSKFGLPRVDRETGKPYSKQERCVQLKSFLKFADLARPSVFSQRVRGAMVRVRDLAYVMGIDVRGRTIDAILREMCDLARIYGAEDGQEPAVKRLRN